MRYDWAKIEREYVTGNGSLEDIADKHHINVTTVSKRSTKGGWVQKRQDYRTGKASKLNEKAIEMQVDRYKRVQETIDKALDIALDRLIVLAEVKNLKDAKLLADTLKSVQDITQSKDSFPKKLNELDAKIKKLSAEADALDKAKDVMEGGLKVEWTNGEWMNEDSAADAES